MEWYKVGNSIGIILPKEALAHLKAGEGGTISLTDASEGSLRLSPAKPEVARKTKRGRPARKCARRLPSHPKFLCQTLLSGHPPLQRPLRISSRK